MEKFLNKYRIPSARASWWDYAADGAYFITGCTAGRQHLFGQIIQDEMYLSAIGQIVYAEWGKSFDLRAELFCDAYIIMPNHIHAILRIDSTAAKLQNLTRPEKSLSYGVAWRPPKSISSFAGGFKSAATKKINDYRYTPGMPVWQTRFHDHIIRTAAEYDRIARYIETNPANWKSDKFFTLQ